MKTVERTKKIMSLLLATIMVLGSVLASVEPAFAFMGQKGDEYEVWAGDQIWYGSGDGGYSNSRLTDLGDDLGTRYSYCVQPDKPSPPTGTVTVDIVLGDDEDTGKWNALRNICYYSPSYPGYDNNVKNIIGSYYTGDFSLDWGIAHMAMSYIYKGRPDDMETYGGTWASGLGDVWTKAKKLANDLWKDGTSKDDAVPNSFRVFICKMSGVQDMVVGYMEGPGFLEMKKTGELAALTKDNEMYSLEGAEYQVFDSSGEVKATLVINAAGDSNKVELPAGTYTVRESVAPKGYAKDPNEYQVEIASEKLTTFTATEVPITDLIELLFTKIPENYSKPTGEGDATLKGAVYKFSYYDVIFNSLSDVTGNPTAVWHFETDEEGRIYGQSPTLAKGYDSSDFYRDMEGKIAYPLGSYVIEEVKESKGYIINPEKILATITEDGTDNTHVETYNSPLGTETPIRGGVKVGKIDRERNKNVPQGDATLQGAEFTVTNASSSSVRVGDTEYGKGEDILVITTGKNGVATSTKDALPYGTYTVRETKAPTGYHLNEKWNEKFQVRENGVIVDLTKKPTDEPVQRGGVKISKIDADLDKAYSQGDATLEGAEFTIYNNSAESVYVNGKEYAKGQAVLTIKTDKNGNSTTKEDTLPYGTYTIKETKPSKGYLLNKEWNKPFEVREPGVIVDLTEDPTEESVIRGGVKIAKIDAQLIEAYAQGDATLEGAEFTIYNKSKQNVFVDGKEYKPGDAVKVITTNKEGIAEAPKDSLPYGSYLIKETKPSEGYLLNETWEKPFEIREEGVVIDLTEEPTPETVMRGGVQIIKRDKELENSEALGGATLSGIEMTVKNVSGHDVLVRSDISSEEKVDWSKATFAVTAEPTEGNESSEEASSEATSSIKRVKPGEDIGKIIVHWNEEKKAYTAETLPDDLPYGTYTIRESKTNSSYQRTDKTEHKFEVREDGTVYSYDNAVQDINGDEANAVDTTEATEGNTEESEAYNDTFVFDNYVYRSDVQGTKIGDGDSVRFSYVPFKITSVSTGENHVVMTDKNGFFTTKDRRTKDALEEDESGETARIQNPLDDLIEAKELTKEALEKRSNEILYGVWFGTGEFESKAEMKNSFGALPYDSYVIEEMSCEQNSGYTLQKFFFTVDEKSQNGFVDLETITDDVPEIGTEASIDGKNANVSPKKEITLVDTIEYRGFKKGETYIAKGKLIDKATGNLMFDAEGKEIIAETEFVAKKVNGKVKVTFTFDGSNMWGKDTVVFETIYDTEGHIIAKHEDLEDEGQTVTWEKAEPSYEMYKIRTTKAPSKGDKFGFFALDEVEYEVYVENTGNVILTMDVQDKFVEGGEYFTSPLLKAVKFEGEGTWNNEGKSDNVANITINPKETAIITYTATIKDEAKEYLAAAAKDSDSLDAKSKDTNMTYQMNEPDDKDGYLNEASCENVTYPNPDKPEEPNKLEPKKDIAQTPVQKPEIGTTLTGEDGSKTIISSEKTVLVDTVAYKGLDPSKWYTVMGTLMVKETGDPFVENGTPVSVESEPFKPKKSEGEIDITFVINTKGLEGKELVAFEVILRLDGYEEGKDLDQVEKKPIAEHNDINDEGQTIKIVKPEEPEKPEEPKTPEKPETPKVSNPPETGDTSRISMYAGIGLVALLSLLLAAYAHEQKDRTGGKENRKNNR